MRKKKKWDVLEVERVKLDEKYIADTFKERGYEAQTFICYSLHLNLLQKLYVLFTGKLWYTTKTKTNGKQLFSCKIRPMFYDKSLIQGQPEQAGTLEK